MNIMSKELICLSIALAAPCAMWAEDVALDTTSILESVETIDTPDEEVLSEVEQMLELAPEPVSDELALIHELMLQNGLLVDELEKTQEKLEEARELLRKVRFDIKNHNEEEREWFKRDLMLCGALSGLVGTAFGAGVMYWLKRS